MFHVFFPSLARSCAPILAVLVCAAVSTTPALARGGNSGPGGGDRPEVRVAGTCGPGATSGLKVKARDGGLETEFWVRGRTVATWRVTIVHEWDVAWRGRRRTVGARRFFSLPYRLPDFSGADHVSVRAIGPRGIVCSAAATLPG